MEPARALGSNMQIAQWESCAGASEFNALSWFGTYRVTCTTTREEIHCARLGRLRGAGT